jgi:hypothetical protein
MTPRLTCLVQEYFNICFVGVALRWFRHSQMAKQKIEGSMGGLAISDMIGGVGEPSVGHWRVIRLPFKYFYYG